MEKSPSPVYGARLELVYGLIAHRGFESLLLRQRGTPAAKVTPAVKCEGDLLYIAPSRGRENAFAEIKHCL